MKVKEMDGQYHLSEPRKAKGQPVPFASNLVPLIFIPGDREQEIIITNNENAKEILIARARNDPESVLLAAWPGEWRQDVFVVNDLEEASNMLLPRELRRILEKNQ
jgi:hypothetical protein